MNRYSSEADDFYVNVNLNTEMELPTSRDTVLHYFEQMKKAFPELRNFYTRENGDLVLEGDKEQGHYRWLALEPRRLCSGHVNPESLDDAYRQHEMVLELAPHLVEIIQVRCKRDVLRSNVLCGQPTTALVVVDQAITSGKVVELRQQIGVIEIGSTVQHDQRAPAADVASI